MSKKQEDVNPRTGEKVINEESQEDVSHTHYSPLFYVAVAIIYPLAWLIFLPRVRGRRNIPKGAAIFASNHRQETDPALVQGCAWRMMVSLGKKELFKGVGGFFMRGFGVIPIDRSRRNSHAVEIAVKNLQAGRSISVFPEGTCNKKEELLPFKHGAVKMAQQSGKPIVPVAIAKPYWPFMRVKVYYGRPMTVGPKEDLEEANARLRAAIEKLLWQQKHHTIRQYDGTFQVLVKPILLGLIKFVYRPKVVGRKNIPRKGPTIVVANHKHDLDPFLIMSGRRTRKHHFIAKHECTDWKIGEGIGAFGVIFVDRESTDKTDMKDTVTDFLHKGRVVALFPEGTRNKTEDIVIPFHLGAANFAKKTGAKLVPAAIVGEYKPFGKTLKIIFDEPISVGPRADIVKVTEKLQKHIETMLLDNGEKDYRPKIYRHYEEKKHKQEKKNG